MLKVIIKSEDKTIKQQYETFTTTDFFELLELATNNFFLNFQEEIFYVNDAKFDRFADFVNSLTLQVNK